MKSADKILQANWPALEAQIRRLALDKGNIKLTEHAQIRLNERDVSLREVVNVLKHGGIEKTDHGFHEGEIKVTMRGSVDEHDIAVALIPNETFLLILTVIDKGGSNAK